MHKIITRIVCAGMMLLNLYPLAGFEIDQNWKIRLGEETGEQERFAASELQNYIEQVSGLKLPIVGQGTPAIELKRNENLQREEWRVHYDANTGIIIDGGFPRGVIYGVYEFIEKGLGCRFVAVDCEYVPKSEKLVFPEGLSLAGKPYFEMREVGYGHPFSAKITRFRVKRKCSSFPVSPAMGGREMDAFDCHSYYRFTKKMTGDMQECFSMDKTGKRLHAISSSGPGQLCWASPKMRSEVVRQFDDMVIHERDVTMAGPNFLSLPLPDVWDISQNDNSNYCECPDCSTAIAKYGANSGAMLEFTNAIAADIRKKHPSFKIQTFAYLGTEKPPQGIVAEPNVIVRLAQLGGEWGTYLMRDSLRPLTHPNNQKALKNLQEWADVSSKISIWDYWVLYRQLYSFPFSNAKAIAENTKLYSSIGSVKRLRLESELLLGGKLNGSFIDLRYFLAMNLMVDPTLDIQALTTEFMQYYFGPAAETMKQLYLVLEKNMETEPMNLGVSSVNSKYLTSEFFDQAMRLLATAEEQAKDCQEILGHIGQERINFDIPMVYMNGKRGVYPAPGAGQRLKDNYHFIIKKYYDAHDQPELIGEIDQYIYISLFKMEIPEQFKEKKVIYDMTWNKFPGEVTGWTDMIDDPVSPAGRTRIHSGISPRIGVNALTSPDYHRKDMLFHVFDHKTKKSIELVIPHGELPKDEQYHWFKVGICNLSPGTVLSLHHSKRFEMSLSGGNDPVLGDQECELWVSVKFQGADYVPGSTMQSAVACDRVMLFSTKE